jgi:hypothetical protein
MNHTTDREIGDADVADLVARIEALAQLARGLEP